MRTITLLIFALALTLCSCSKDYGPQEYHTVVQNQTETALSIIINESIESWTDRVLDHLQAEEILVTEYWTEKPEKGPFTCGCWDCQVSGVSLHIISESDPDLVRKMGFVLN